MDLIVRSTYQIKKPVIEKTGLKTKGIFDYLDR
jgi:hypothetical protein